MRAFGDRGISVATHQTVADVAGVSLALVFAYFPTRTKLRSAVMGELRRHTLRMVREAYSAHRPPLLAIRRHLELFTEFAEQHPHLSRFWLDWSTALEPSLARSYRRLMNEAVKWLTDTFRRDEAEGTIRAGIDAADGVLLLTGAIYVLAQGGIMGRNHGEQQRLVRVFVEGFASSRGRELLDHRG